MSKVGRKELLRALEVVWKENEDEARQEAMRIGHKILTLKNSITQQVEAAMDDTNSSIKGDILELIKKKKQEVADLEDKLDNLQSNADNDKERFLEFAWDFIDNTSTRFFEISKENQLRCKELIFPAGFHIDANEIVYTPEISPLYSLATTKKDLPETEKSFMVRVGGL